MPESSSNKVVYIALFGNIAVAISKFLAAAITGSAALLAEAFHSSADTGNEFLLLLGRKRSRRPADEQHPFGYGRELYFWAFIVAMSVFAVGGCLSIYEGIRRLQNPEALSNPTWNYVVLGVAAMFEGYSWNFSRRMLNRRRKPGETMWHVIHRSKDPSVFTVFIEDSTALVGLFVAFLGVLLSHIYNASWLDASASIVIGILLVLAAGALAMESGGLLIGEGAEKQELRELRRIIASQRDVEQVGDILTMQLGPDEILLVADVGFRNGMDTDELERSVDEIEACVRRHNPGVKRIFFEAESFKKERRPERAA